MSFEEESLLEEQLQQDSNREDIVNRPEDNQIVPATRSEQPRGSEKARELQKYFHELAKLTDVNVKNEDRKEREYIFNKASLNESNVQRFKKLLDKVPTGTKGKPAKIKYIFYENDIKSEGKGFTLTEMAKGWLEYFGLEDSVTLDTMKERIARWIRFANKEHDARIHGTPISKRKTIYHINTQPRHTNKQAGMLQDFEDLMRRAKENRLAEGKIIRKENEEQRKQKIVINNEGTVITAAATNNDDGETQEQEENSGEDDSE